MNKKRYFVGVATNWQTGRLVTFCVRDRNQIPASCRDLVSIYAGNKREARHNYLFAQL